MITLKNVTKKFGDKVILKDINLTFENGKVYALVGKSGCGKTTLLNIIAHLESYDSGEVLYHDVPLHRIKSQKFFKDELGYLFQNFGLLDSQSIEENLDLGCIGQKLKKAQKMTLQKQALERVGLDYLTLDQKIYTLSGGEAQRVALAKIILKKPPLILADEPTAALDPKTSKEIMDMLLSLKQDNRIIILATHNPIIWELADEVIRLNDDKAK